MNKLSKEDIKKLIEGDGAAEYFVFTPEQHEEFLANFKKTSIDSFEQKRVTEIYNDLDKDFFNATGIKRPADQKTYNFWPETMKQLKEKSAQTQNANPDITKELEAVRKASLEKDKEWEKKFGDLTASLEKKEVMSILEASIRGFKFTDMPEPVLNNYIETVKSKLASSAKIIGGEVNFFKDNELLINKQSMKPMTAAELLAAELDPVISKKTEVRGGGTEPPKITKKDGKIIVTLALDPKVKTKTQLTDFLVKEGIAFNTPEFYAAYEQYGKNLE
jgi:hypothetical protein